MHTKSISSSNIFVGSEMIRLSYRFMLNPAVSENSNSTVQNDLSYSICILRCVID